MATVKYQTMPPLSPDEYRELEESIVKHGVQVPILLDEDGAVIDGHHRQKIAQEHGLYCPSETRDYLSEAEKNALSITLNIARRQLNREQKREITAAVLMAQPERSNRDIGREVGVSHHTVDAVRDRLVESGQIAHFDTRTDPRTGNASQPARRPVVAVIADAEAGEVINGEPSHAPHRDDMDSSLVALINDLRGPWSRGITQAARRMTPAARQHVIEALQSTLTQIKEIES